MSELNDIMIDPETKKWHSLGEGAEIRVLRIDETSGQWVTIFRMAPGSKFAPHKHLGAGEYLMLKGEMHYRGGHAKEGYYGYEPLGVIHEGTFFPDGAELLFIGYGPVAFTDADGNIAQILDWEALKALEEGASGGDYTAKAATAAAE